MLFAVYMCLQGRAINVTWIIICNTSWHLTKEVKEEKKQTKKTEENVIVEIINWLLYIYQSIASFISLNKSCNTEYLAL